MTIRYGKLLGVTNTADPEAVVSAVEIERFSQNLVVKEDIHAHIHKGVFFSTGVTDPAVSDNAFVELLIQAPAGAALHVRFRGFAAGEVQYSLHEGVTFSDSGTKFTPVNRNRRSANEARGTYSSAPTVTDLGTTIFQAYVGSGEKKDAFGAETSSFHEYILAESTDYLVRLQNLSGADQSATLAMDFYDTGLTDYG